MKNKTTTKQWLLVGLLLIGLASWPSSAIAQEIPGFKAFTYKQIDTINLKLYVKFPSGIAADKPLPAIVFFFGGGWNSGEVTQFRPHAEHFVSRGMVAVLVDYRVRNRHQTTPFDAVSDAKSALRYLRKNAEDLHIDPERLAAAGGSAGGHLAAAAALVPQLNDPTDDLTVSPRPNALVLFNPVFDNSQEGYGYDRVKERYTEISPIHNITSQAPPTIVFLGTADHLIPVTTAERFKQKMEEAGSRCDLFLYKDQKHGFFNFRENGRDENRYFNETLQQADWFLVSLGYLKGGPGTSFPANSVTSGNNPMNGVPAMHYGDTARLGIPFSKDPHVVKFKQRYLMYYSVPPYSGKSGNSQGWGIAIAESSDLTNWTRIGEVNRDQEATYESKGLCAPCALIIDGKVHLFYQTYGNGKKDAICHAWSNDGIHFTRNKTNPVFSPDGNWNCGRAIDAEVVPFNGKYFLYYATRDTAYKIQMQGVAVAPGNARFNRSDWKNLSVEAPMLKPELPWERDCIEAASIIEKNGELFMFYAGGYNNAPQQIGVAKSKDGIHWSRMSEQPFLPNGAPGSWNASESGHPHIFANPDGDDRLFFQGNNTKGKDWYLSNVKIGWTNGIPFIKK